ncbi:MAG: YciI family protein [Burkholderiales bacterium]|nr:YciI family protein [Burkholderiales bacterium]
MKYLCLAYYNTQQFAGMAPDAMRALVSQCPAHDAKLRASGRLVMQASLGELAQTRTIHPKNGKPSFTDGPFVETKEQVGGFFIIDARDMDDALRIASLHPAVQIGEQAGWCVEVRPIEYFEQQ